MNSHQHEAWPNAHRFSTVHGWGLIEAFRHRLCLVSFQFQGLAFAAAAKQPGVRPNWAKKGVPRVQGLRMKPPFGVSQPVWKQVRSRPKGGMDLASNGSNTGLQAFKCHSAWLCFGSRLRLICYQSEPRPFAAAQSENEPNQSLDEKMGVIGPSSLPPKETKPWQVEFVGSLLVHRVGSARVQAFGPRATKAKHAASMACGKRCVLSYAVLLWLQMPSLFCIFIV